MVVLGNKTATNAELEGLEPFWGGAREKGTRPPPKNRALNPHKPGSEHKPRALSASLAQFSHRRCPPRAHPECHRSSGSVPHTRPHRNRGWLSPVCRHANRR